MCPVLVVMINAEVDFLAFHIFRIEVEGWTLVIFITKSCWHILDTEKILSVNNN